MPSTLASICLSVSMQVRRVRRGSPALACLACLVVHLRMSRRSTEITVNQRRIRP